jgi:hypothetical protein
MHHGVPAPWAPDLGTGLERPRREGRTTRGGHAPEHEVRRRERVGLAERAQRDVLRGPGAEPGERGELGHDLLHRRAEIEPARGHGARERLEGTDASTREAEAIEIRGREQTSPEKLDVAQVLGYLGGDNVLYCSPGCAAARGQADAAPVDQQGYQALVERGALAPVVVCPVCGSDYPFDWSADDQS